MDIVLPAALSIWFFALFLVAGSKRAGAHHLLSLWMALTYVSMFAPRTLDAIQAVGFRAAYTSHPDAPIHFLATSFFLLGAFSSWRTIVKPARRLVEVEVAQRPIR